MTVDNVRCPSQFFYRFQHPFCKENHAHVVVREHGIVLVVEHRLAVEKLLVINKINLKSDLRNAGHLDNQGVVGIINNQIHSAQTDHFV